jgi:hypothetical protein
MSPALAVRNLVYAYPDGLKALRGVDWNWEGGCGCALPDGTERQNTLFSHRRLLDGEGQ